MCVCMSASLCVCVCVYAYVYTCVCLSFTYTFACIPLFPQHLSKLNSLNTLWAVVGAFLHFSIERLHQTWDEVPKAKKEVRNNKL